MVFSRRALVMSYSTSSISALQAKQGKARASLPEGPPPGAPGRLQSHEPAVPGAGMAPLLPSLLHRLRHAELSKTARLRLPLLILWPCVFINHICFTFSCKTHVVFFLKNRETSAPSPSEFPKPHWVSHDTHRASAKETFCPKRGPAPKDTLWLSVKSQGTSETDLPLPSSLADSAPLLRQGCPAENSRQEKVNEVMPPASTSSAQQDAAFERSIFAPVLTRMSEEPSKAWAAHSPSPGVKRGANTFSV